MLPRNRTRPQHSSFHSVGRAIASMPVAAADLALAHDRKHSHKSGADITSAASDADGGSAASAGTATLSVKLTSVNPTAAVNHVIFDHASRSFVSSPLQHQLIDLFSQQGTNPELKPRKNMCWTTIKSSLTAASAFSGDTIGQQMSDSKTDEEDEDVDKPEPASVSKTTSSQSLPLNVDGASVKLFNAFNFHERATQTITAKQRHVGTQSMTPQRATFGDTVSAWRIYDAYMTDLAERNVGSSHDNWKLNANTVGISSVSTTSSSIEETDFEANVSAEVVANLAQLTDQCRVMERVIQQNTNDSIIHDFRYYDDPTDEFNDREGRLLPLWKISTFAPSRGVPVTSVRWIEQYSDLLLVTFGSISFKDHSSTNSSGSGCEDEGLLCIYSLTNVTYPEHYWKSDSGVMCADLQNTQLCVGLRDGRACVLAVQTAMRSLQELAGCTHSSSIARHDNRVTAVRWSQKEIASEMSGSTLSSSYSFFSSSADGTVFVWLWDLAQLQRQILFSVPASRQSSPDALALPPAGITSMAFSHALSEPVACAIGTDNGDIFCCRLRRCSAAAAVDSQSKARAVHGHAVTGLEWSPYTDSLLVSGGADWRVLVWQCDHHYQHRPNREEPTEEAVSPPKRPRLLDVPLLAFDLNNGVSGLAWAPHSSTVLAVVSIDGFVCVFDISMDLCRPVCRQLVVEPHRAQLLTVAFSGHSNMAANDRNVVILGVGDSCGAVHTLKLSPNLRRLSKEAKNADAQKCFQLEVDKVNRLFDLSSVD